MEEIENFSNVYKERLDEIGERGEIPDDLGLQVKVSALHSICSPNISSNSLFYVAIGVISKTN